jgi:hypothetical protein
MADQAHYQAHCAFMSGRTPEFARQVVERTLAALRQSSVDIAMAQDRNLLFQVSEAIQTHRTRLETALSDQIQSEIDAAGQGGKSTHHIDHVQLDELTLVDEDQAEREIDISRTVQLIDLTAEWELRELQSFSAVLQGEQTRRQESNPFRPAVYAKALSTATRELDLLPGVRHMLLRVAGREMAALLRALYAQACDRLKQQGIRPLAYKAVTTPRKPNHPHVDVTQPGALQSLLARIPPSALPPAGPAPAQAAPNAPTRASASGALTFTQGLNPFGGDQPAPRPTAAGQATEPQMRALLTQLFAQMVRDNALQPAVKDVISVLQPSVARVALHDPQLLRSDQHPAWRLINQVASYATGYTEPDQTELTDFVRFLKPLVQALAQAPAPDARQFNRTLNEVQHFIGQQSQSQLQPKQEALAQLQAADQRMALQPLLRQQVEQQLAGSTIKDSIKAFLLGPWLEVLTHSVASGGLDDDLAQSMLVTVDDLIHSLQRPRSSGEQDALRQTLPGLIARLQQGMQLIALPQAEQDAVLDELMSIHGRYLRTPPKPPKAPAAATPEDLVAQMRQEMRDEMHADMATEPASSSPAHRSRHPQVVDTNVGTLPTVPMVYGDETPDEIQAPNGPEWSTTLRTGMWCKLFLQGQWTTAHLLWVSANRQFFMFTSDQAGRMHSMTRRALERLRAEGLATSLEDRSLMQRAVDSLLQDLGDEA